MKLISVIKVGEVAGERISPSGKTVSFPYYYRDVKYDKNGWADCSNYLPKDYDLVYVKVKDKKITSAWMSGKKWMGLFIKPEDEILFWKRKEEED